MYYIYGHFLDGKCIYIGSNCGNMNPNRAYDFKCKSRGKDYLDFIKGKENRIEVKILKEFPDIEITKKLNGYILSEELKYIKKYHDIGEALFSNQDYRGKNNGMYGISRFKEDNPMYGKHHTKEARKKMSENHANFSDKNNPMYGKHHTKETRIAISKANIGKIHSEESRRKMSNSRKELRWINDGICSKRVNLKELNFYLSRGYTLGRMSKRGDDYV